MCIIRQDFLLQNTHTHACTPTHTHTLQSLMFVFVLSWRCFLLLVSGQQQWDRWERHPSLSSSHTAVLWPFLFLIPFPHFISSIFIFFPPFLPFFSILLTLIDNVNTFLAAHPPVTTQRKILECIQFTFLTNCALPSPLSSCFTEAIGQ